MHDPERLELFSRKLAELGVRPEGAFRRPEVVVEALTHSSFATERGTRNNERLEMLGDSVLGYLVTELLFDLFENEPEGVLTRLRASLVDERALAAQARRLDLGQLIALGRGEEQSGGRDRQSLLADAFEAVFAAVYRSEGIEVAAKLCRALFDEEARKLLHSAPQPADFKTALQERTQGEWKVKPHYEIIAESGPDHARTFVARVRLLDLPLGEGSGRKKQLAEQAAARAALDDWKTLHALVEQRLAAPQISESGESNRTTETP